MVFEAIKVLQERILRDGLQLVFLDEIRHNFLVLTRTTELFVLHQLAMKLKIKHQSNARLYLSSGSLGEIVEVGRILSRNAIRRRATTWQVNLKVGIRRHHTAGVRLGHEIPHHMIEIRGVRDFYSSRFWVNF